MLVTEERSAYRITAYCLLPGPGQRSPSGHPRPYACGQPPAAERLFQTFVSSPRNGEVRPYRGARQGRTSNVRCPQPLTSIASCPWRWRFALRTLSPRAKLTFAPFEIGESVRPTCVGAEMH